jgi:small GTP-binding protein
MSPNSERLIRAIERYLGSDPDPAGQESDSKKRRKRAAFVEVVPELILPFGNSAAYSLDDSGDVSGIKLGLIGRHAREIVALISEFEKIRRLVLHFRVPIEIPESIGQMRTLEFIWLNGQVKTLPESLFRESLPLFVESGKSPGAMMPALLSNDVTEFISRGGMPSVAHGEQDAPPLREQLLAQAADFSRFQPELAGVRGIYLAHGVALEDPPLEIVAKGYAALYGYFSERAKEGLRLNELKIILVGNGGSGKTSLVKRLIGEKFDPKERQTHGINIRKWSMRIDGGSEIKLNFWDFGGQEIMHSTHQFFLSKRSAYILVLDGRKDEDPEYWLQHIVSFGGDSPIFVVLNKVDEHPAFEVNRRFLVSKYRGIVDFIRVSCAKNQGVEELSAKIKAALPTVPMLQTRWPVHWFRVKDSLERDGLQNKKPYVSLEQFRALCEKFKVSGEDNQELLVEFLHDLGVVLHFRDIQLLDTHVLDPRWVTEGVYRIINSRQLAEGHGILALSDIKEILKRRTGQAFDYPQEKHAFIIDLMLKFELCYKVGADSILVPDLLDIQEPQLDFNEVEALQFIFEYAYLPKSIMPRFIVRMHTDIKNGMRWRTGVLLSDQRFNATALVRADPKANRIYVTVNGSHKRDYFSVVRKMISDINASFERLSVTELVPLPDQPAVLIDYQELLGHEKAGVEEMFNGRTGKKYDVQKLLNGVESPASRRAEAVIHVEGNYYAGPTTVTSISGPASETGMQYSPATWEKVVVYASAAGFLGLVGFLLIRNQPIADPNLVVALRLILSFVVAAFGATIPGLLKVDLSARGLSIRAVGALALFVLAYVTTPQVLPLAH